MDNNELAAAWVAGLTRERRGSNMRADDTDIWSYAMLLARKYPGGYYVLNEEDYSRTTSKHRAVVRGAILDSLGYGFTSDKVLSVHSRWDSTLPPVGDVLQSLITSWLPQIGGHNWGTMWGGASPAALHLYPEVLDSTSGRVKTSLWGGDPQVLRGVLGAGGGHYDLAVLEHVASVLGLQAATEWLATAGVGSRWHLQGHMAARLLLCYGATTIPTKVFDGYTGQAWDALMACPPEGRPALASEMMLRKNRFFADAARAWLQNYNKEKHT